MSIIDSEKIVEAKRAHANITIKSNIKTIDMKFKAFEAGLEFAEKELSSIAIEFAKWMFSQEVTKCKSMTESESYIPKEFNLMKGELIVAGESLLEQFLKEYNGR